MWRHSCRVIGRSRSASRPSPSAASFSRSFAASHARFERSPRTSGEKGEDRSRPKARSGPAGRQTPQGGHEARRGSARSARRLSTFRRDRTLVLIPGALHMDLSTDEVDIGGAKRTQLPSPQPGREAVGQIGRSQSGRAARRRPASTTVAIRSRRPRATGRSTSRVGLTATTSRRTAWR